MGNNAARNKPCPCGSGRKYKLCHYRADAEAREQEAKSDHVAALTAEVEDAKRRLLPQKARPTVDNIGLLILTPSRGNPRIEFCTSLAATDGALGCFVPCVGQGVLKARNLLADAVRKYPENASFIPTAGWYCLWVDDDAFWRAGAVIRAFNALSTYPEMDAICGWFGARQPEAPPSCSLLDGSWPKPGKTGAGGCKQDSIVEVERFGFHWVMHKVELIDRMAKEYGDAKHLFDPEGTPAIGEDMAWCWRARKMGLRLWCDTSIKVWHVDSDHNAYLPGELPYRIFGGSPVRIGDNRDYGDGLYNPDIPEDRAESGIILGMPPGATGPLEEISKV